MSVPSSEPADRPSSIPWPPFLLAACRHRGRGARLPGAHRLAGTSTIRLPATSASAIGAAGVVLLVWAIMTLRRHGTTVLPDVGATALVTDGPYWRYRNPIYLADVMILLGDRRTDEERVVRRRRRRLRRACHLARHPARGTPPRAALRQGVSRLQGNVAPLDLV